MRRLSRSSAGIFVLASMLTGGSAFAGGPMVAGPADAPARVLAPGPALLSARLSGANEVDGSGNPGVGDPDGAGSAEIQLTLDPPQVCATLLVTSIEPATAAHIHQAPAGVNGAVVVTLPTPSGAGTAQGCVTAGVTTELLAGIAANPAGYYVNVHNGQYPNGAVRGQLE
jgi:CHRD domain